MTDLTEQWKKGELHTGWYWVKDDDGQIKLAEYSVYCIDRETNETEYDWSCLYEIEQVLAEVPDYIDWRNMVNCACEEHEANKRLIEENAQLKEQINKCCLDAINRGTANTVKAVKEFGMPERIEELVKQNAQLKELLKEWVQFEIEENPNDFTVMSERMSELANKTKEVLK